jgi:hypothetical protein
MKRKDDVIKLSAIAGIMLVVATIFFAVIPATPLFITAYIFAVIGIGLFAFGNLFILKFDNNYPWVAAFPITTTWYLVCDAAISIVFLILENLIKWSIPLVGFMLIQIIVLAIFSIRLIVIKGARDIIVDVDNKVSGKVTSLKMLIADIENIRENSPQYAGVIKPVYEALKYSDPMGNELLSLYDEQIGDSISRLEIGASNKDDDAVNEICVTLLTQIKDRNNRVRALK